MKVNPFKPNSPTSPGMFTGRLIEIKQLKSALIQTKSNQNVNFLLTGERGIGKTSLLNLIKYYAEGHLSIEGQKLNYLVIDIDITKETKQIGLVKKIELSLLHKLEQSEKAKKIFNE